MNDSSIPQSLKQWAASDAPCDPKIGELMRPYAEAIDCPRCFVYCRNPDLRRATTTHAWWSEEQYAIGWESWFSSEWVDEGPANAPDPLFAAALADPTALYIEDVENDSTGLVNFDFERTVFKHSALIHAPVYHQGKCYGILEPSAFGEPRHWSEADRQVTAWAQAQLGPLMAEYVAKYGP